MGLITLMVPLLLLILLSYSIANIWEKPGCYKVGHTRKISIPDCIEFDITTNACRGYCVSFAVPSPEESIKANPKQTVTSYGHCCNILDTEDVHVKVMCLDGLRQLVFKSAVSCECFICKRN